MLSIAIAVTAVTVVTALIAVDAVAAVAATVLLLLLLPVSLSPPMSDLTKSRLSKLDTAGINMAIWTTAKQQQQQCCH